MKIQKVLIRNYRSLKDISIDIDDYTAFIGVNSAGKSSILYALDWFFNNTPISNEDIYNYRKYNGSNNDTSIEVTVIFDNLTDMDKTILGKYGYGDTATFRKSWHSDGTTKFVGNALQGKGFDVIRNTKSLPDMRKKYQAMQQIYSDLPDIDKTAKKDEIESNLSEWESKQPYTRLEEIKDQELPHARGFDGTNMIKKCVRYFLIPASGDMTSEISDSTNRKSILHDLISVVTKEAGENAVKEWLTQNEQIVNELNTSIKQSITIATSQQSIIINKKLDELIPGAQISFTLNQSNEIVPNIDYNVSTDININGFVNEISKQGHGVQRAVLFSMIESLAPAEHSSEEERNGIEKTRLFNESESESTTSPEDTASHKPIQQKIDTPQLVFAIEEPEIYQHPIRARAFARALSSISTESQIIICTHSPYFVRPNQFTSLRLCSIHDGQTTIKSTSIEKIQESSGDYLSSESIEKFIGKELPTIFSESFFADINVIVEGDTDQATIEAIAERQHKNFDSLGINIYNAGGKNNIPIPYMLLRTLGIPTYIIVDGDAEGAKRTHKITNEMTIEERDRINKIIDDANNSHKQATLKLIKKLSLKMRQIPTTSEMTH